MTPVTSSARQVREAAGLPAVLEAARAAFEAMLAEIEARQDPASPMFAAFVMAAAPAADGRDAALFAPSLDWPPPGNRPGGGEPGPADDAAAAGQLASLCRDLDARLAAAAGSAAVPADRAACRQAARRAREIADLLTGGGQ
jgi:hypothetical protein